MPTLPESEGTPDTAPEPADALRARLRAVAEKEQSKREQPAQAAPAEKPGSDLWDAPKPQVEEPISQFLIPIPQEELRPHERVEVPKLRVPAELPKARVVSLPAEEPKPEETRVALEAHVERLLTLLRTDEVDEAIAQQDTPTIDAPTPVVRTRWQLTKELIGVAKSLPPRVLQVIATAIGRDNLASAKDELVSFRQSNPGPAKDADVVLRTRAKSIQRGVAGALYVEPVITQPPQFTPAPNYNSPSSSSANVWWIVGVVVLAVIKIAVRTSSHSSYDYSYTPSYDYSSSYYDDYAKTQALLDELERSRAAAAAENTYVPEEPAVSAYEEPAEFDKEDSADTMVSEIERSMLVLRENEWLTDEQSEKMSNLWVQSPYYTACSETRSAMYTLEKQKAKRITDRDQAKLAKSHLKAIRTRVDAMCPPAKRGAAKKKPAETVEAVEAQ